MIKGIEVEITIRDNKTGAYLRIPVLPSTIAYSDGDALSNSSRIINLGNIDFPNGVDLDRMGWNSFFPARYDPGYCSTPNLRQPLQYRNQFSTWKDQGTSLQVICPAAGINKTMRLRRFTWDLRGFEGDIYYSVEFSEVKTVRPKKLTPAGTAPAKGKKQPQDRPAAPAKPKPKTYTVKSGDWLTKIAKSNGIANWRRDLYEPNRGVIGPNPDLIRPGQVLKLP